MVSLQLGLALRAHQFHGQLQPPPPNVVMGPGVGTTHQVNVVPRDGTMRTLNFLDPISSSARHVYTLPLHCHTGGGRSEDEDTPLAAAPRNQSQPDLPPGTGQLQLPPTCLPFPRLDKAPPPQTRWRVNVGTFVRELGEAHCVCGGGMGSRGQSPRAPGQECTAHPQLSALLRPRLGGPRPSLRSSGQPGFSWIWEPKG